MNRIRQALDRARLERAGAEPVRFESLPPLQLSYLPLAEFADADPAEPAAIPPQPQAVDNQHPAAASCEIEPSPAIASDIESAAEEATHAELAVWEVPQTGAPDQSLSMSRFPGWEGSRLSRFAPLFVSSILGLLIIADLSRATLLALGRGSSKAQEPQLVRYARQPQRRAFDVHDIVAAHLFGEAADPSKHDPANTQSATANLLLAGTLAMEDPKHGIAIISNSGRSIAYRVGDSVADGELHSVYRDHILLLRRGILESLVFPRSRLATNSDGQPVHVAEPDDPLVSRNPSAGDVFRGIASLAPGGKLRGFRIYPTGNPQRLQESGLNSGDLVVAVNGVSLEKQNFQAGREMFNSVKTSRQVTVTVDRGGVRHDFTVNSQSQADPADSADESDAADQ